MGKGRMEAFSDGVLAIIITIMVLELKVPHHDDLYELQKLLPVFLSYILSFTFIGIYWNNHHHLMQAVHIINGKALWANMHLLFWLSLIPFASGWMGENHFTKWPVALYGFILLMAAIAYYIFAHQLLKLHGHNSTLAIALGNDRKGKVSILLNVLAVSLALIYPLGSLAIYALVAFIWFLPDTRIEKNINSSK